MPIIFKVSKNHKQLLQCMRWQARDMSIINNTTILWANKDFLASHDKTFLLKLYVGNCGGNPKIKLIMRWHTTCSTMPTWKNHLIKLTYISNCGIYY